MLLQGNWGPGLKNTVHTNKKNKITKKKERKKTDHRTGLEPNHRFKIRILQWSISTKSSNIPPLDFYVSLRLKCFEPFCRFFSCCLFFFRDKSWWKPIQSHVLSTHIPKAVLLPHTHTHSHTHTAPFNMHKRLTTTNALTQLSTPWVAGRHWDFPWDRGERGAEPVDGGGYIQSLESRQLTGE